MDEGIVLSKTFLEPARVLVNIKPTVISTVVGPAVAVTMWDRLNMFGGMCHFLYPEMCEKDKTTVEYGNVAVYVLIKTMKEFGSNISDLDSQLFGGAEPLETPAGEKSFGDKNVQSARDVLCKYHVRIVSEDTGGHIGRKIAFNTLKNEVLSYKVQNLRSQDWNYM